MLKTILLVVVVLILALVAFAATRPDTFRVERSATIKAPADKLFPLIDDFHAWAQWSPWEKLDPQMKRTHSGAASGKGEIYEWEGNKDVGKGRMEITESTPPTKIVIKLDFLEPYEQHAITEFDFAQSGDSTKITWAMSGQNNFMSKLMCIFMNMDSMIGKDFEAGLANLRAVAEK